VSLHGGEDFGADLAHPDLVNNLWANTGEVASNGVDDDGDGFICDTSALGSGDSYVVFLGGAVAASTPPGTAVPRIRLSGVRGNRSRLFFVATGESLLVDHRGQSLRLRRRFRRRPADSARIRCGHDIGVFHAPRRDWLSGRVAANAAGDGCDWRSLRRTGLDMLGDRRRMYRYWQSGVGFAAALRAETVTLSGT
jgi:hypothetical protein